MANKTMRIDKSLFDADELATYEALVAKATVDPEAAEEEMEDEVPPAPPKKNTKKAEVEDMDDTKKSATPDVPDFVKDAIAKSEEFITRIEKQEQTEIAKKYAILGEKPEELGEKLYNLKKSDPAMYDTCISMLDSQVALIEKTGMFAEVGKSAGGQSTSNSAVEKADAKAREIMKADPSINYTTAIAKAWDENPELMDEYDAEFSGNK